MGTQVYEMDTRSQWLKKLPPHRRKLAEILSAELDAVSQVHKTAEQWLLEEAVRCSIVKLLATAPGIGMIRGAQIVAIVVSPDRFRTRQQFWSYCGLGVVTRSSSDWTRDRRGTWARRETTQTRGLNRNRHPILKAVFKGASLNIVQSMPKHVLHQDYQRMISAGMKPNLARITVARKIAAAVLGGPQDRRSGAGDVEEQGGVRPGEESAQARRGVGSDLRGIDVRDDSARRQSATVSRESIHLIRGPLHAKGRPPVSGYAPSEHLLGAMADGGPARRMVPAFSSGMPNTAPPCHQHRIISHEHQHVARTSATASNSRDADSPEAQRLDATANRPPDVGASSEMDTCPLDISPARRNQSMNETPKLMYGHPRRRVRAIASEK